MSEQQINERKIALDILLDVKRKGEPLAGCLNRIFCARNLDDKRSRAFITQLVYGTVENIIRLDHIIDSFSKIKTKKMKPGIAAILELSAYQIIYMDSVPASAACDEAVKLTKKIGMTGLSGFVNAVIRNISNSYKTVSFPGEDDFARHTSLEYSLPEWCVELWERDYGRKKAGDIAHALRNKRPLFIRVNTERATPEVLTEKLQKENVNVRHDSSWPDAVLSISDIDSVASLKSFRDGLFYIQDISCVLSGLMYGLKKGDKVLDLCAAPGGKSINAALLLRKEGGGSVVSCDVSDDKVALIGENISRMGLPDIEVVKSDATEFTPEFRGTFDVVIADVPCSGLGIIGRKPDIAIRLKESDIEKLAQLQKKIIDNGIEYVKEGGRFVFSTCTLNKSENEGGADYINDKPGIEKISEETFFPGDTDGDGFFTAVFKKV